VVVRRKIPKPAHHLIREFYETGSMHNRKHNHSPTVLSNYMLEDVRLSVLQSAPNLIKLLQQQNMSLGSAHKVTQLLIHSVTVVRLKLHSIYLNVGQELLFG
jgi:hypothetical protein